MTTPALYYPAADRKTQWAFSRFPGDVMKTNTVILHTTETVGWPSYSTGYWPNLTYHYGASTRWRQHLPLNRSARALENKAGGIETNTLNCIQIEIVGSCDPRYHKAHGGPYVPDMPDEMIDDLAEFAAFMHREWGVELVAAPKWPSYATSSKGGTDQRFTAKQWLNFYGWAGHMHVPENSHLDPGDIPIATILERAKAIVDGAAKPTAPTSKPEQQKGTTVASVWDERLDPGPVAEQIGGYKPGETHPARDYLMGADAKLRRLVDDEAARYDDLLANHKSTQGSVRDLDTRLNAIQAQLAELAELIKGGNS